MITAVLFLQTGRLTSYSAIRLRNYWARKWKSSFHLVFVSNTPAIGRDISPAIRVSAPDAMVIVNQEGKIVLINSRTEELFGYTRQELLGYSLEVLIPERFHAQHLSHREAFGTNAYHPAMSAGLNLYAIRKDGTEFPVEISLSPISTAGGLLVSSAIRDMTVRQRAEDKFRALLEAAPDAMVIVDQYGKITLVNAQTEKLFGYSRADLIGQAVERLVPERYR